MSKESLLAACAIVGALLGVFNLIRSYLNDSERLKVAVWGGDQEKHPSIEVINCSAFPVTVVELGRVHQDGQVGRVLLAHPAPQKLPARIEARDACTFNVSLHDTLTIKVFGAKYWYVRTALGSTFTNEATMRAWLRRVLEATHLQTRDLPKAQLGDQTKVDATSKEA